MPYAKVLPISNPKSLTGKLAYLSNARHPNHKDKTIEPPHFHRVESAAMFSSVTVTTLRRMQARQKKGRKIKNLADEIIIRAPDQSHLTAEERAEFLKGTLEDFCPDSPAVAVWHLDNYNGSADLHIIVANFIDTAPPKLRRVAAINPIALVRATADRITDILNVRRREQDIAPIQTMQEVRRERLKERGIGTLAERLAPLLPFAAADLPGIIGQLGYEVTRYNSNRGTVSVRFEEGKKPHRYIIDRLMAEAVSLGGNPATPPKARRQRILPRPISPNISLS